MSRWDAILVPAAAIPVTALSFVLISGENMNAGILSFFFHTGVIGKQFSGKLLSTAKLPTASGQRGVSQRQILLCLISCHGPNLPFPANLVSNLLVPPFFFPIIRRSHTTDMKCPLMEAGLFSASLHEKYTFFNAEYILYIHMYVQYTERIYHTYIP